MSSVPTVSVIDKPDVLVRDKSAPTDNPVLSSTIGSTVPTVKPVSSNETAFVSIVNALPTSRFIPTDDVQKLFGWSVYHILMTSLQY